MYSAVQTDPIFPSLQLCHLGGNGKPKRFPLNARNPIDIDTDLFKGKVLVLVRPENPEQDDPYWNERLFSKKKRRLMIQIQGKFQREPQGVVYAGAEVTEKMKLGLVSRGLCQVLLKLVQTFNQNIHYSFGDGEEMAHICAPAYTFFERVVATPQGETPPPMDEPFPESAESLALRNKTRSVGRWNTSDIYSFSFYSMYIDLPTWQLVGLPATGDLSFKTFWGDSLLRICMYEKVGESDRHTMESKRYAFTIQAKFLGKHHGRPHETEDESSSWDEEDEGTDIIAWSESRLSMVAARDTPSKSGIKKSESQVFEVPEEEDNEIKFYDGENESESQFFFDAESEAEMEESERSSSRAPTPTSQLQGTISTPSFSLIRTDLLMSIDYACPARVDIFYDGKAYVKAFAVNVKSRTSFRFEQDCRNLVSKSSGDRATIAIKETFSPRLASMEKLRRAVGFILFGNKSETGVEPDKVKKFEKKKSKLDGDFLLRPKPPLTDKERPLCRISGFVARALSERHWIEEFAMVMGRTVAFYSADKFGKPRFRVSLSNVTRVERLPHDWGPQIFGYHILTLTTLGRTVYMMFHSDADIDAWIKVLESLLATTSDEDDSLLSSSESTSGGTMIPEFSSLTEEYLHKSTKWDSKNRRILNCATLCFRKDRKARDPLFLAQDALQKGLELTVSTAEGVEDAVQRRAFLDSAAELKRCYVEDLTEKERLAFYLNIYHLMITHAFLVLGPPDSKLKWKNYFSSQAYQFHDELVSLAELEHCIIRASMAPPKQLLSRFTIPKSKYSSMALKTDDFRVNFALNCGSLSNPSKILIYRPKKLEEQLDTAARLYLQSVTCRRTSTGDLEIELPRICQWYMDGFGGSKQKLLQTLELYLPRDVVNELKKYWLPKASAFDTSRVDVKYQSYKFECRPLSL